MTLSQLRARGAFVDTWLPRLQRARPWLLGLAALIVAALVVDAFVDLSRQITYDGVVASVRGVPGWKLGLALAATALSFFSLTGYDASALRYAGARVPYRVVAKTAFIAYALSNMIGLGVFTGGAVRLRLYGAAGVEAGLITRAIAFNALAFGLGISVVGAGGVLLDARELAPLAHMPVWVLQALAIGALALAGALMWACRRGEFRLGPIRIRLPAPSMAWQQLGVSVVDIVASAAVMWFLLPDGAIGFPAFVGFYAAAMVLGVISHVPGGLGVFEAVMLLALKGTVPSDQLAGALVLYRLIYYVLPLLLAMVVLAVHELRLSPAAPVGRAVVGLAPHLLAAFTAVVAIMLLVSGVTPATDQATALLAMHVPLMLVEASHFLSSIAGVAMLFVARALLRRLDAAWWAAVGLTLAALVLALPKGLAVDESLILGSLMAVLLLSRKQFTRKASLLAVPFSGGWLLAMVVVCVAVTALLFFVYRDVAYANRLWWQFEFDGNAPRSLRAMVGVSILALVLALRQLLRPPAPPLPLPSAEELARAQEILRRQPSADAALALTGDKPLLFSEKGDAFVMFGRKGKSWVALFDPVGPREAWPELVWRFLERARESGARGCFYQVRPDALPLYLDAGLRLFKLGEYAWVPLAGFSLQGKRRGNLRNGVNRSEREGLSFSLVERDEVAAILPELRAVSDAWLAKHNTAEKRFSVGAFDDAYMVRNPVAVVRREGKVIAFASLLVTDVRQEASIDLMRQLEEAPNGTMDFLFSKLMLHFAQAGYVRFGLGMAPLSGMAGHALAPRWHRIGRLLFAHGEHFYNFRGLRAFKEKFDPQWEARYLAAPGGMAPLLVMGDVAALISGGYKGVIRK
ncbi:bifunctional lysylphosphatidylglycerol flippase/synthetase MprF [Pseudoxanthomonas winnipegensis]|uniref:bifunctional lysylphosphatidylglycerol flippase/synthetase MprF n=1 Tax=Pseudoxanthomonas winnipegensis TaxID=2480810 RepID=UPI00102DE765|nr:bifunctional lysylphosphatidylglycerol flippase/synthetase MprF [Pseudoxanthomonas winnipegensis]TAA41345.1 bifunctional lysylphosphatidylglycerol flippase/synthetase MprF [Pseudoxanthomonas winnipegensis]